MKNKIRKRMKFETFDDGALMELEDKFHEFDVWWPFQYATFHGTEERYQELIRACKRYGLVIK